MTLTLLPCPREITAEDAYRIDRNRCPYALRIESPWREAHAAAVAAQMLAVEASKAAPVAERAA